MTWLRLIGLAFWAAYSVAMGLQPRLNAFGTAVGYSALLAVPLLYMLPTIEAWLRQHGNLAALAALNLLAGWTLLGWVGAFVWALRRPEPVQVVPSPLPAAGTKACPFCAEQVLAAAVKCKHCGSELPAHTTP